MMNTNIILCGISTLLIICIFYFTYYRSNIKETKLESPKNIEKFSPKEDPMSFTIFNYLKHHIRIEALLSKDNHRTYESPVELVKISPQTKKKIPLYLAENYINKNTRLRIYTYQEMYPGKGEKLYAEYKFNTPGNTTIKKLHVGMITSRWTGADADYNIDKPGLNAVQGLPWIKIHNLTDRYLALNNNINISPGGTLRYTGRDHFGVRLGTVFKDQDEVFPTFIFTVPATDVYYGVVSDLVLPKFSGYQNTSLFIHSDDEPQYLLESGWMGGPAQGQIPLGRLPIEGPEVPPKDRWGQNVPAALEHPVGSPIEENDPQDW